jgi:hypothetical protein
MSGFQNVGPWCVQIAARPDGSARLYVLPTERPDVFGALVARADGPHALVAPLTQDEVLDLADSHFSEVRLNSVGKTSASFASFPHADEIGLALQKQGLILARPECLPAALESRCCRAPLEF